MNDSSHDIGQTQESHMAPGLATAPCFRRGTGVKLCSRGSRVNTLKTLHLMRHAKSAWDEPGLADRARGLNKRGRRDAPRMGAALATELLPQAIAVSPARRAQLTLAGLCAGWPALAACDHVTEESLYTFGADELRHWITALNDEQSSVFIIGHNPALTELVNTLLGQWQLDNLPTAGYARLSLSIDRWSGLKAGCGQLDRLLIPRELPD